MTEQTWLRRRGESAGEIKTNKGQKRESVKTSLLWLYSQVSATGFANVKVGEGQTFSLAHNFNIHTHTQG